MSQPEPVAKYPHLSPKLDRLRGLQRRHLDVCARMLRGANGDLYLTDFVILAILQRSLDMIDAVTVLIGRWNFNAAAPLLRIQLDSLLKLFVLAQTKNSDDVAKAMVLSDKPLHHVKDKDGKPLTDARLRKYARPYFPWIDRVYEETSRVIHLSDKHFINTIQSASEGKLNISLRIQGGMPNWPPQEIEKFLDAMIATTEPILHLVDKYAAVKNAAANAQMQQSTSAAPQLSPTATDADAFFRGLVTLLETQPLSPELADEDALEEALIPAVRTYTSEHVGTNLTDVLYHHHNQNWPISKQHQNVAILGRDNTGDIFIRHPSGATIFIDLKLTKKRHTKSGSDGSDDLPGSLQRAIGQAVIASMRHPYVISFVVYRGAGRERVYDATDKLLGTLWTERRVKLILRDLGLPPLIDPERAPVIPGVASPQELYWVLQSPAPLAGMRFPREDFPWQALAAAGLHYVVALESGQYNPAPLKLLSSVRLEDLAHGGPPKDPVGEEQSIRAVAQAIVTSLKSGHGVVVHCAGGRGRSGTVIGGALRTLGYGAEEIIEFLDRIHRLRGKSGWPESPWQSELVRRWDT